MRNLLNKEYLHLIHPCCVIRCGVIHKITFFLSSRRRRRRRRRRPFCSRLQRLGFIWVFLQWKRRKLLRSEVCANWSLTQLQLNMKLLRTTHIVFLFRFFWYFFLFVCFLSVSSFFSFFSPSRFASAVFCFLDNGSKHKKIQTNADLFWHWHTVCKFSGKSPLSSHKTTHLLDNGQKNTEEEKRKKKRKNGILTLLFSKFSVVLFVCSPHIKSKSVTHFSPTPCELYSLLSPAVMRLSLFFFLFLFFWLFTCLPLLTCHCSSK